MHNKNWTTEQISEFDTFQVSEDAILQKDVKVCQSKIIMIIIWHV